MKSIRRTLMCTLLGGVALAAVACGTVLHQRSRQVLTTQFDSALRAKALQVAALLEIEEGRLEFDFQPARMPEYMGGEESEFFQLFLEDGQVLYRSATLEDSDLPNRSGRLEAPEFFDLELRDGREGRATGLQVTVWGELDADDQGDEDGPVGKPSTGKVGKVDVVLVVARARTELTAALATLRNAAGLSGAVLALLVLAVVLLAVRRGLRPVNRLGEQVARMGADSLSERILEAPLPLELRSMVRKLNELLDRLEKAFLRERRLTANVAHELRNPIAELRNATDVALTWPDDEEMQRHAIGTAQAVAVRMSELITGLLRLARVANGQTELAPEEVDLHAVVEQVWSGCESEARVRGLQLDHRTPVGVTLKTDRALFTSAVSNLIENAVHYAAEGTSIVCGGKRTASGFEWTLSNPAQQLAPSDLGSLTEPFWQKDSARSDSNHAGLGLTLVSSIADALHLKLEFRLDSDFCVTLSNGASRNGNTPTVHSRT